MRLPMLGRTPKIEAPPRRYPDKEQLERTANAQTQSHLFARLPLDIRLRIYEEVFKHSGLVQHVCKSPRGDGYTHWPCSTDHDGEDDRQLELEAIRSQDGVPPLWSDPQWHARLQSPWANHWACGERMGYAYNKELYDGTPRRTVGSGATSFLSLLLTCKKM